MKTKEEELTIAIQRVRDICNIIEGEVPRMKEKKKMDSFKRMPERIKICPECSTVIHYRLGSADNAFFLHKKAGQCNKRIVRHLERGS